MRLTLASTLKNTLSIFNDLHNNMTIGNAILFIDIAANKGTTNKAIADRLGISTKTVSKQLSVIRDYGKLNGSPLIFEKQNEIDKRIKELYLTDHGNDVVKNIEKLFNSQNKLDSIDIRTLFEVGNGD